ncbi:hypothetical protein QP572_07795 [Brevibacterium sp. UMB10442]|nr:hypothetical protein [Brevibacterium sp. UMB10442]
MNAYRVSGLQTWVRTVPGASLGHPATRNTAGLTDRPEITSAAVYFP